MRATTDMPTERLLDGSAIGVSALCLAHCLSVPAIAALAPAAGAWIGSEWAHVALVAVAAPITLLALLRDERARRPSTRILALAAVGVAGLVIGALAQGLPEIALTVSGSLALISAHVLNWRRRRSPVAERQIRSTPRGPLH